MHQINHPYSNWFHGNVSILIMMIVIVTMTVQMIIEMIMIVIIISSFPYHIYIPTASPYASHTSSKRI